MRRARRVALVAALILAVVAAPGLASLTTAAPSPEAAVRVPTPVAGEKASLRGGTAHVRLLGVNDLHGYLQPPYAVDGRKVGGAAYLAAYLVGRRGDWVNVRDGKDFI